MENFVNGFIECIYDKIPIDICNLISQELSLYTSNFDITQKVTDVTIYNGFFPKFYKAYFVSRKVTGASEKTLSLYKLYLDDFFCSVNKNVEEINANDILVYLYNVQKLRHISNRTLDSRRSVIHAFFEWATDENYLPKNPCRGIKPIKYDKKMREPLSNMELLKIRMACNTLREKALIEFLYSTGCRVSEVEEMNIEDIRFFDDEAIVRHGKGNKERKTYLSEMAKVTLQNYLNSREDSSSALFVWDKKPYNRLRKPGIEKLIKEITQRTDIKREISPHYFRHTMATEMLNRGGDITSIQKILGHVNIATTMVYAKCTDQKAKKEHSVCIS